MSVNTLLTAMETAFKTALTGAKTVEISPGPYTPQLALEQSFTSPALFFGVSAIQTSRSDQVALLQQFGQVLACRFTAVVVARHAKNQAAASSIALLMTQQLCSTVHRQRFGLEYVGTAYQIAAEPMAKGSNEKLGQLSFWRVSWWHDMALSGEQLQVEWAEIDEFMGYDADHFWPGDDSLIDVPKMQTEENYA